MYQIRWPLVIVIISIVIGTGLGAFYGASEETVKNYLEQEIQKNELASQVDESTEGQAIKAKLDQIKSKSWRYFLRAHFHGGAIATMSLAILLLLGHMTLSSCKKKILAYGISISGFIYPFFWLFSGMYGPSLGTGVAKAKFEIFAYAGAVHILLTLAILFFVLAGNLAGKEE